MPRQMRHRGAREDTASRAPIAIDLEDAYVEDILDYLWKARNCDLRPYKRAPIVRSIRRRMSLVGLQTHRDYRAYLTAHPSEFPQLLDVLRVKATEFFRDRPVWIALAHQLGERYAGVAPHRVFRIWSAGCSTG